MTDRPSVMRLRRPRVKDPRLITGIVLMLASVLAGAGIISSSARTTTALVATADIAEGEPLTASAFTTTQVNLGDQGGRYVTDVEQIPEGSLATSRIGEGELLTISAVGQSGESAKRPISVPVDASAMSSLVPGAVVELWSAPTDGEDSEAQLLVPQAQVRAIREGSGFGATSGTIELLVPQNDVPTVLAAMNQGDTMYVIQILGASEVSQ